MAGNLRRTNAERLENLESEVSLLSKCVARIEGEMHNGLQSRVRVIEKMQWWQIGIMVTLLGSLIGGMWIMLQRGSETTRENQRLLTEHIRRTEPAIERLLEEMR